MAGNVGEPPPGVVAQHLACAEVAGKQKVRVPVPVNVRKCRREGEFLRKPGGSGLDWTNRHDPAHILEAPATVIAPQILRGRPLPVPRTVPVGEEQVEVAVIVVVGGRHRVGFPVEPDAEGPGLLPEATGSIVTEYRRPARLDRQEVGRIVPIQVDEISSPVHAPGRQTAIAGKRRETAAVPAEQPARALIAVGDIEFEAAVPVDVGNGQPAVFFVEAVERQLVAGLRPAVEPYGCGNVLKASMRVCARGGRTRNRAQDACEPHTGNATECHRRVANAPNFKAERSAGGSRPPGPPWRPRGSRRHGKATPVAGFRIGDAPNVRAPPGPGCACPAPVPGTAGLRRNVRAPGGIPTVVEPARAWRVVTGGMPSRARDRGRKAARPRTSGDSGFNTPS